MFPLEEEWLLLHVPSRKISCCCNYSCSHGKWMFSRLVTMLVLMDWSKCGSFELMLYRPYCDGNMAISSCCTSLKSHDKRWWLFWFYCYIEVVTQSRLCCMMWFLCPQGREETAVYRSYGALCWYEIIQQQLRPWLLLCWSRSWLSHASVYGSYGSYCWAESLQQILSCFHDNDIGFHAIVHAVDVWMDGWMRHILCWSVCKLLLFKTAASGWRSMLRVQFDWASRPLWVTILMIIVSVLSLWWLLDQGYLSL